jgi:predicted RNA-binding Zn ribbon-like protein
LIGGNLPPGLVSRTPAFFTGDHLALDFVNSRSTPSGVWTEWLGNGIELLNWLEEAGAIEGTDATRFREDLGARKALDEVAERARTLREWLRGFIARHAGREIGVEAVADLGPLNDLLARSDSYWQVAGWRDPGAALAPDQRPLRLQRGRRWTTPEQLLQPLAEAIADLVCNEDFRLIRTCEGKACVLLFLDRTKAHARRWCSMALCGNRAKAAAHRARAAHDRSSG